MFLKTDLTLLDALADHEIDYSDAPVPDLGDWVRHARPFKGVDGAQSRESGPNAEGPG